MNGKWIAVLLVLVAAGVVIAAIIANSKGEDASVTEIGEPKGYVWDGELERGAIRDGRGTWKPFYK